MKVLELAFYWDQQGDGAVETLVDGLLEYCARQDKAAIARAEEYPSLYFDEATLDDLILAILVAEGNPARLCHLIAHQPTEWLYPVHPWKGWQFLDFHRSVQAFLSHCVDHTNLIPPVMKLLSRIALAARLPASRGLAKAFTHWEDPPLVEVSFLPESFPVRLLPALQ